MYNISNQVLYGSKHFQVHWCKVPHGLKFKSNLIRFIIFSYSVIETLIMLKSQNPDNYLHWTRMTCDITFSVSMASLPTRQVKLALWSSRVRRSTRVLMVLPNCWDTLPSAMGSPFRFQLMLGVGFPPWELQFTWMYIPSTRAACEAFRCITGSPGASKQTEDHSLHCI